jgi:hypothetical protein
MLLQVVSFVHWRLVEDMITCIPNQNVSSVMNADDQNPNGTALTMAIHQVPVTLFERLRHMAAMRAWSVASTLNASVCLARKRLLMKAALFPIAVFTPSQETARRHRRACHCTSRHNDGTCATHGLVLGFHLYAEKIAALRVNLRDDPAALMPGGSSW